jgi:hypothetical protein
MFVLYLSLPERGSVGSRFFESTANTTYLKVKEYSALLIHSEQIDVIL